MCVDDVWSDWGWNFGEGANFYFLAEGLKIELFGIIRQRKQFVTNFW